MIDWIRLSTTWDGRKFRVSNLAPWDLCYSTLSYSRKTSFLALDDKTIREISSRRTKISARVRERGQLWCRAHAIIGKSLREKFVYVTESFLECPWHRSRQSNLKYLGASQQASSFADSEAPPYRVRRVVTQLTPAPNSFRMNAFAATRLHACGLPGSQIEYRCTFPAPDLWHRESMSGTSTSPENQLSVEGLSHDECLNQDLDNILNDYSRVYLTSSARFVVSDSYLRSA